MYEGEVTEITPQETENPFGGYGKTIAQVIIGLKTVRALRPPPTCTSIEFRD